MFRENYWYIIENINEGKGIPTEGTPENETES